MSNILVVEIKMLTKTPKFLSVPLCGTIPHSPTLCMFSSAHLSEGDSHPLPVVLIHTTVSSLSSAPPQPPSAFHLLGDTDSCLCGGIVNCFGEDVKMFQLSYHTANSLNTRFVPFFILPCLTVALH